MNLSQSSIIATRKADHGSLSETNLRVALSSSVGSSVSNDERLAGDTEPSFPQGGFDSLFALLEAIPPTVSCIFSLLGWISVGSNLKVYQ